MAAGGERTPLVAGSRPRPPRIFLAKLAAVATVLALLALLFWHQHASTDTNSTPAAAATSFPTDPDWFCGEHGVETGHIRLANKKNDHYFYWFARSRSSTNSGTNSTNTDSDPLVLWLNGGPGSSSLEGLLVENGPCLVRPDLSKARNAYAWNTNAHVIWLEQPSGVGFSFFTDDADRDATGEDVGANLVAFLDGFLASHPEFLGRDFYLTGESYAGHYIPAAAFAIHQTNQRRAGTNQTTNINLRGIAIGNGDPNLPLQYQYAASMATDNAYNATLLNASQIQQMQLDANSCADQLTNCQPYTDGKFSCAAAAEFCDSTQLAPFLTAKRNAYDLRQPCSGGADCSDTDGGALAKFLTAPTTRQQLAPTVGDRQWNAQVGYVYEAFTQSGDWARSYMKELVALLDEAHLRVLIYAGDADLVCNWIGNRAWTLALDWSGKDGFNAAQEREFVVDGVSGGVARSYGQLSFLRVFGAGHLVPKDQPKVSLEMLQRFLKNEPL